MVFHSKLARPATAKNPDLRQDFRVAGVGAMFCVLAKPRDGVAKFSSDDEKIFVTATKNIDQNSSRNLWVTDARRDFVCIQMHYKLQVWSFL